MFTFCLYINCFLIGNFLEGDIVMFSCMKIIKNIYFQGSTLSFPVFFARCILEWKEQSFRLTKVAINITPISRSYKYGSVGLELLRNHVQAGHRSCEVAFKILGRPSWHASWPRSYSLFIWSEKRYSLCTLALNWDIFRRVRSEIRHLILGWIWNRVVKLANFGRNWLKVSISSLLTTT